VQISIQPRCAVGSVNPEQKCSELLSELSVADVMSQYWEGRKTNRETDRYDQSLYAASRVVNNVFSGSLKTSINVDVVTSGGKLFHTRMPATPKTQSPVSAERLALTATQKCIYKLYFSENAVRGV